MASNITKMIVIVLILNLIIPANAMAWDITFPWVSTEPVISRDSSQEIVLGSALSDEPYRGIFGDVWFEDAMGRTLPPSVNIFPDTLEWRLKTVVSGTSLPGDIHLDMVHKNDAGTWVRHYNWTSVLDYGDGVYGTGLATFDYHNTIGSGAESQQLIFVCNRETVGKVYAVLPVKYRAPDMSLDDVEMTETLDHRIHAKVIVNWATGTDTLGAYVEFQWIPRVGGMEPEINNQTATGHHGSVLYHADSEDIEWNTPGWLQVTAKNNYGDTITRTLDLPYSPLPPPTESPTIPPTTIPTYEYPTVIPTGALTYPTPIPTAPIPTVTQAPIGTVVARGVPTWSSSLVITPETLPVAATPTLRPIPMTIPEFRNVSVPSWVRNPIPVVGPAANVSKMFDGWIDQTVAVISSPYDAMLRPFTTWIAGMAAGMAQSINALTTWITGFTTFIHGLGDMLWLLIPLPVWVAGALMVWLRFLQLVILYLGSGADMVLTELLK